MAKFKTFITNLDNFITNTDSNAIKANIGDSTNNNRTPTVSQVIRYLTNVRTPTLAALGFQLEAAYDELIADLHDNRIGTRRTDAFDINEFIIVYTDVVLGGTKGTQREFNGVLLTA